MSFWVPPRRPGCEWLDDPSLPSRDMAESLGDIARVDRAWGGSRRLARWLAARTARESGRPTIVLDIGAGAGLTTRRMRRSLGAAGVDARVFALDVQWRHLAAGARMDGCESLPGLAADAFRLPLASGSVDWIVATLLLHHFSPEALSDLFREIRRVTRRGFALLDLCRHRVPLAVIAVAGRLAFKSGVSVHDGVASARQAYTPEELRAIVQASAPGARVDRVFPFRLLVSSSELVPRPLQ